MPLLMQFLVFAVVPYVLIGMTVPDVATRSDPATIEEMADETPAANKDVEELNGDKTA